MKSSSFEQRTRVSFRIPVTLALALFVALGSACTGGLSDDGLGEGDRCNPSDVHNECGNGLQCTGQASTPSIAFCPENYCCPLDGNGNITGSNPNCQPGCNGGAAAICAATKDTATCAFAYPDAGSD